MLNLMSEAPTGALFFMCFLVSISTSTLEVLKRYCAFLRKYPFVLLNTLPVNKA